MILTSSQENWGSERLGNLLKVIQLQTGDKVESPTASWMLFLLDHAGIKQLSIVQCLIYSTVIHLIIDCHYSKCSGAILIAAVHLTCERLKAGGEWDNRGWDVGWHHQLDGQEFQQVPEVGDEPGSLACCSPWGCRVGHDWATELNWLRM